MCPLHVASTSSTYVPAGRAYFSNGEQGNSAYTRQLAIKAEGTVWSDVTAAFIATSDRRVKKNIVDVPDNLALEMVRNIPCRYYEYRDRISNGNGKTIGFIAQEVKEILPMAISFVTQVIPNEMRRLENISWEEITDGSNNTYKLTSDLRDCSGVKYRFYVTNDISGNETMKEVVGNNDDTFTFEEKSQSFSSHSKIVP